MTTRGGTRFVYFAAHLCPGCRAPLDAARWSSVGVLRCARCGLVLAAGAEATPAEREAARVIEELADHARAADGLLADAYQHSTTDLSTGPTAAVPDGPATAQDAPGAPGSGPTPVAARRGLSSVSVPALLLALGGLSLVVAAAVFLAVHWSAMSLAGRTLVLLVVTAASGASALWVARRRLRAATETLSTLTVGLAVLDVHGAWNAGLVPSWSFLAAHSTRPVDAAAADPTTATLAYATLLTAATLGWAALVRSTAATGQPATGQSDAAPTEAPTRLRGPEIAASLGVLVCLGAAFSLGSLIGYEPHVAALFATAAALLAAATCARFVTFARVGLVAATFAALSVAGTAVSSASRARSLFQESATDLRGGLAAEVWTLCWTAAFTVVFAITCAALAARAAGAPARRRPWQSWASAVGWTWLLLLAGIVLLADADGWVVALSASAVLAAGLHTVVARVPAPDDGPRLVAAGAVRAWTVLAGVVVTAVFTVLVVVTIVGGGLELLLDDAWAAGPGARWPVVDDDVAWWWLPATAAAGTVVAWALRRVDAPTHGARGLAVALAATLAVAAVTAAAGGVPLWLLAVVLLLAATALLVSATPTPPRLVAVPVALMALLTVHGSPAAALAIGLVVAAVSAGWPRQSAGRLARLVGRGPSASSGADTSRPRVVTGAAWGGAAATATVLALVAFTVCVDWWGPTTAASIGLLALALAGAVAVAQWFRASDAPGAPSSRRRSEAGWSVLVVGAVTSAATLDAAAPGNVHQWWLPAHLVALGATSGVFAKLSTLETSREAAVTGAGPGRGFAWCAAVLVLASSWVRLAFEEVSVVEAYTLPAALVLGAFAVVQLRSTPREASTGVPRSVRVAAAPASLLLVPSLVALADDPVSWRAVWVAVVCGAALAWGLRARVAAGVVYGCAGAAALILVEAAPVAAAVPRWVALGVAGLLLVLGGVRWEHVLSTGRQVWSRVGQMR